MEKLTRKAEEIMVERFGKDSIIALATTENGMPYVRNVNAFYEDKAFYVITYRISKAIPHNPVKTSSTSQQGIKTVDNSQILSHEAH